VHLTMLGAPAQAQDAGSLLREQERREELQRLERLTTPEKARPEKAPARAPETGETILVNEIRYTGKLELLSEAERAGLAAEAMGQRLGVAGLQALVCGFHAIRPPSPRLSGRAFHAHPAICSTAIRPGSRSAATQVLHC
jgi:hemolysin activation/secretion protein